MVRLGDVLDYEQPSNYIIANDNYNDKFTTPVLTAGKSFILGYTDEKEGIFNKLPVIIFDDFTTAIKYVDFPFKVKSSAMKILKSKQGTYIKYAYYLMTTIKIDTELHKRYWISQYSNIQIPLPPLGEQKKIADELDTITGLITKRKVQIAKLDVLVKAKFVEMFGDPVINPMGWEEGTIRDIVSEVKYGTSHPAVEGGKYPYLRMNNITYEGHLDTSNLKQIDIPQNEYEKCVVKYGDILFNRTNSKELVGKTCIYNLEIPMIVAGYIIRVRVNEKAIPIYLSSVLNSKYGKHTLFGICKAIVGQANINAQELQNIKVLIPPLPLQNKFADYVTKVEDAKTKMQNGLKHLEMLYKERMQEYFE